MFLHIGNGKSVLKKNIIGIFDLDTSTVSKIGKDFINKKEKEGLLEYDDYDLPRSFVLIEEKDKYKIKLSRISSLGLKTRAEEDIYDGE
ncbi:MAG: DUF370 domain-containing protein [Clostridia bacterium]|nr:DUF370 domain-containing protein [Clostridia bacterium]MBR3805887.1 DUF370 domain-containing protein [Clostridia bacterium]